MGRLHRTITFAAAICILSASGSFALDIDLDFQLGNLAFDPSRTSTDTSFPGTYYNWGISAYAAQSVADNIRIEGGLRYDPVLRYSAYSIFSYTEDILTVWLGPYFGLFNDLSVILNPGLSAGVKLQIPGVMFLSIRSDSSIQSLLLKTGDCLQELTSVSFGFYVVNAICTLGYSVKSFTKNLGTSMTVDSQSEYSFRAELFQKNIPYRIAVNLAYQSLSKSYIESGATTSNVVNSIVISPELDLLLGKAFVFYTVFDGCVFSFGEAQLIGGTTSSFLFRVSSGFRLSVDALSK